MGTKMIGATIKKNMLAKLPTTTDKNGNEYLGITIVITDEPDKFGNHVSIQVPQTKEQREAKEKKEYAGSGKVFWQSEGAIQKAPTAGTSASMDDISQSFDEGLPF